MGEYAVIFIFKSKYLASKINHKDARIKTGYLLVQKGVRYEHLESFSAIGLL